MEFKGTKGSLERKYVSGICIGIGTLGQYSQITANSILPDTDKEYEKEKIEIEANMQLYAHAPEMLNVLIGFVKDFESDYVMDDGTIVDNPLNILLVNYKIAKELIKKATTI